MDLPLQAEARSKLRSAAERDRLYITAMAERFSKGAGALKGHRWREQEAKFAQQMQKIAEDAEVKLLDNLADVHQAWHDIQLCVPNLCSSSP